MNKARLHRCFDAHKDKLSNCVMVFGAPGLAFYAAIFVGSFALKYTSEILGFQKGMGL